MNSYTNSEKALLMHMIKVDNTGLANDSESKSMREAEQSFLAQGEIFVDLPL